MYTRWLLRGSLWLVVLSLTASNATARDKFPRVKDIQGATDRSYVLAQFSPVVGVQHATYEVVFVSTDSSKKITVKAKQVILPEDWKSPCIGDDVVVPVEDLVIEKAIGTRKCTAATTIILLAELPPGRYKLKEFKCNWHNKAVYYPQRTWFSDQRLERDFAAEHGRVSYIGSFGYKETGKYESLSGGKMKTGLTRTILDNMPCVIDVLERIESGLGQTVRSRVVKANQLTDITVPERTKSQSNAKRESPDQAVRSVAADALGEIKNTRAVEPLIARLKDSAWDVRLAATGALGSLKDARAVEPLIACLGDSEVCVRSASARALAQIGASAVDPLIAVLKDSDSNIREGAVFALGEIKDSRAVLPLIAALNDSNKDVRERAANALRKIRDARAVEPLIAALGDLQESVRWAAVDALGEIEDTRAVGPLVSVLTDPALGVRKAAASALGEMEDDRATASLISSLSTNKPEIVAGAYKFFIRLGARDSEDALIAALNAYGYSTMAKDFLNCRNARLASAAKEWANTRGYVIYFPGTTSDAGPVWHEK